MKRLFFFPLVFFVFAIISCSSHYRTATLQYSNYRIGNHPAPGADLLMLLKPYSDSINKSMNDVLGINDAPLRSNGNENVLGYFMTDAYLYMARNKFNSNVDAAFMNRGGVRLQELPAGNITRGKIFELMPFDNILLLVAVKGSLLKQYLDTLVLRDQVIVSGISLTIKNRQVQDVRVGNKPLDENEEYIIANSDYTISNSMLLKSLTAKNIGYLQRDALIDYVTQLNKEGKKISVPSDRRVTYAE
jgi:2',3'-cyclic-nucleotide 2'-phosphodiesterase (5'-nucleotidase family)